MIEKGDDEEGQRQGKEKKKRKRMTDFLEGKKSGRGEMLRT